MERLVGSAEIDAVRRVEQCGDLEKHVIRKGVQTPGRRHDCRLVQGSESISMNRTYLMRRSRSMNL